MSEITTEDVILLRRMACRKYGQAGEDLAQDVLLNLWRTGRFDRKLGVNRFFATCLHRQYIDVAIGTRNRLKRESALRWSTSQCDVELPEIKLSQRESEVFPLYFRCGLTPSQIGLVLGMSGGTATGYIQRILRKYRAARSKGVFCGAY